MSHPVCQVYGGSGDRHATELCGGNDAVPLSQADRDMAHQALPEPMLPGNLDGATGACVHDEPLHLAALQGSVLPCLGLPQAPCVEEHIKP